jgi:hypothetical protein
MVKRIVYDCGMTKIKRRLLPNEKAILLTIIGASPITRGQLAKALGAVPSETTIRLWFQRQSLMPTRAHAWRVLMYLGENPPEIEKGAYAP